MSASQKDLNSLSFLHSYFIDIPDLFLLCYQRVICIQRIRLRISSSIFMIVIIDFYQKLKGFC